LLGFNLLPKSSADLEAAVAHASEEQLLLFPQNHYFAGFLTTSFGSESALENILFSVEAT
jgi:hypothetical protein